ncbi:tetratricopeptide repeat protein [Lichenifustis flavocetrariae]|uniref:Tetratricopeptide repeat protein n=1 Tax=Lichenifustis flavocetrariae TaxID=2949735 RepID=A0AA41Z0I2_9HYPH|nr:tetratricopeptide repeat protein [Lichenifustis flavocetrariae]MCW6510672.1 hypothetical protein [Lichenifustis flavocetrariae]
MRANVSPIRPQALRSAMAAAAMTAALSLGGCFGINSDVTGSIAASAPPSSSAGLRDYTATWSERYKKTPGDKVTALNYVKGLRAMTQYSQAAAVMEAIAIKYPYDQEVLATYGKTLADAGRFKEAADVLGRAHTPENPNWSVLSAQGSVADQLGDHAQAQAYYSAALKIKPADPHVLSNLGLSYALDNQLPKAEMTMRQASQSPEADMRVRQNFALVLALDGKFDEAEQVAERDLSPSDAAASVASIRGMIAQSNTWRPIQQKAGTANGLVKAKLAQTDAAR